MTQTTPQQPAKKPAQQSSLHFLCFRLVDQQNNPLSGRRYTMSWTNVGSETQSAVEGVSSADGRTTAISTRGQVPVSLSIAPLAGGECRPIGQSTQSKPENGHAVVTVRLAFNATATTAPESQDHCETLTLRQGKQRVKYVINNVPRVRNGGKFYGSNLKNLPYLIVDASTLEVLQGGQKSGEPAKFRGTATQVSTREVAVDGVQEVGIVLGAAASGGLENWQSNADRLIMYRVVPESEGLTTVVLTETVETNNNERIKDLILANGSGGQRAGTLNGKVWAAFTRSYTIEEVGAWIDGNLTLANAQGDLTSWYQADRPSLSQIEWAENLGKIEARQAEQYRNAIHARLSGEVSDGMNSPSPLRMQLKWRELLEPFYCGQITSIPDPSRRHSQGGEIIVMPLNLTLKLRVGFCDNAGEYTEITQAEVLAKNHPYIYMMLLSACAEAGVSFVEISGMWRPMLGSYLHKLGDALDIMAVDAVADRLPRFNFSGSRVAGNALAQRFSTLLYEHRYANSAQHIYKFDDYPHSSDGSHDDHLHITCMSQRPLEARDSAGYVAAGDFNTPFPSPVSPHIKGIQRPRLAR